MSPSSDLCDNKGVPVDGGEDRTPCALEEVDEGGMEDEDDEDEDEDDEEREEEMAGGAMENEGVEEGRSVKHISHT